VRHVDEKPAGTGRVRERKHRHLDFGSARAGVGRGWGLEDVLRHHVRRSRRPTGLRELLAYVRGGDTVVVWKLDRLGRNMLFTLQTVKS
jgi:hypothetical protein